MISNYGNFTIHKFDKLDSTNSHAFNLANSQKIFDHEIIISDIQEQGRGRKDRNWQSPKGNLYFSIILQPKISASKIHQISFVAITALQIAIEKITTSKIEVKWPNDLLINGKKAAGILLESKINQDQCQFVVMGLGLNIKSHPQNTIFEATNLKENNCDISKQQALEKFLDEFENLYQNWLNFGFDKIRNLWLKNAYQLNATIKLKIDNETISGFFKDLDCDGNLLLQYNNQVKVISAADILA